jgi:hypothetical protein
MPTNRHKGIVEGIDDGWDQADEDLLLSRIPDMLPSRNVGTGITEEETNSIQPRKSE